MYIEKGTYGCVIKPSIPCEKYHKDSVSKIFHKEDFYKEESMITDIMKKIDPKGKHILKKIDECKVKTIEKKDRTSCKYSKTEFPKYQIVYEYGGMDLSKFTEKDFDVKSILPGIYNLTSGLVLLEKHRMCHRDIKETNILCKNNLFYFIDVGLALSYDRVYDKDQDYILRYNYCYYPPEFKIYYNMKHSYNNLSSIDNIEQFIQRDVKLNYVKSGIVYDTNLIDNAITSILKKFSDVDMFKLMMIKNANKIDVFSLGMVLMNLLLKSNNKYVETKMGLLKILDRCVELNPYKRISPKELSKSVKELL